MNITEAAAYLGVSRKYIQDRIKRGELQGVPRNPLYRKQTKGVLLNRADVEAYRARLLSQQN